MTIDKEFLEVLNDDARILITRAFDGKSVTAFGVDGNGEFGTSYHGHTYKVDGYEVLVDASSDVNDPEGFLMVSLEGYDANAQGHVITDQNLRISLRKLFEDELIDPACWTWGSLEEQGRDYFVLRLNINKLLGW